MDVALYSMTTEIQRKGYGRHASQIPGLDVGRHSECGQTHVASFLGASRHQVELLSRQPGSKGPELCGRILAGDLNV